MLKAGVKCPPSSTNSARALAAWLQVTTSSVACKVPSEFASVRQKKGRLCSTASRLKSKRERRSKPVFELPAGDAGSLASGPFATGATGATGGLLVPVDLGSQSSDKQRNAHPRATRGIDTDMRVSIIRARIDVAHKRGDRFEQLGS